MNKQLQASAALHTRPVPEMVRSPWEVVGDIISILCCFIVGVGQQWKHQQLHADKVVGPEEEWRGGENDVHLMTIRLMKELINIPHPVTCLHPVTCDSHALFSVLLLLYNSAVCAQCHLANRADITITRYLLHKCPHCVCDIVGHINHPTSDLPVLVV